MLKKCAILGLFLLVLGGSALGWLRKEMRAEQQDGSESSSDSLDSAVHLESYGRWYELTPEEQNQLLLELDKDRENKTPADLLAEQRSRLKADLDRLASGDLDPGELADYLYGPNWEDEVALHNERKAQQEMTQTASIVCLSIGGTLFGSCTVIWILGLFARAFKSVCSRRKMKVVDEPEEEISTELTDICHDEPEPLSEEPEPLGDEPESVGNQSEPLQTPLVDLDDRDKPNEGTSNAPNRRRSLAEAVSDDDIAAICGNDDNLTSVLLADEPSQETDWSPTAEWSSRSETEDYSDTSFSGFQTAVQHTTRVLDAPVAEATPEPLQDQADSLQEQIAEFKEMAQTVQQATREQSVPINSTLKELAQQVSAIRDYAASQQDRVTKLQEGYDWNIIRTFCLRVIRCLDNIEMRIERLNGKDSLTPHLEEVRDELLFALESSGVEQYRPEINSDYRGQEKLAETIKDKEPTKESDLAGKIAKVVRPGYRYMIDEESAKIVRTAQVKLYG